MEQTYMVDGPLEVSVRFGSGHMHVRRADVGTAQVQVRPLDPAHESSVRLAAGAEVHLDGSLLTVSVPDQGRLFRRGEVVIALQLPADSRVAVKAGMAAVAVRDGVHGLDAKIGAGSVDVDRAAELNVKAGQVDVVVGRAGSLAVSSGQGTLRAGEVEHAAFKSGAGDVEIGHSTGVVQVKGGAVQLAVRDAASGEVFFHTGSGDARVAVVPGTTVELDLTSGSGDVRCELPVESAAPPGGAGLRLRLRTGSGDLIVTAAAGAPASAAGAPSTKVPS